MKNHFCFSYPGNKRQEVDRLYNNLNLVDIKYIVEPFCGTSAFSYYVSTKHPGEFQYILNDNNKYLVDLYNILKNVKKCRLFEIELNEVIEGINDKEGYENLKQDDNIVNWFILNKHCRIRPGFYPQDRELKEVKFDDYPIVKFLREEKVRILNNEGIDIVKRYKDKKNCLVFLDPPYLNSTINYYKNPNLNIFEYLATNKIQGFGCRVILCLNDNWVVRLLFEGCVKEVYDKQYESRRQFGGGVVNHLVIANY